MLELFSKIFGKNPTIRARAPGRINIIGEHTDYNDGLVLPVAVNLTTTVWASARKDKQLSIYSLEYRSHIKVHLDSLEPTEKNSWSNYVTGVAAILQQEGVELTGANLLIESEVPQGAGLSSSAALEVATAGALLAASGQNLSEQEMARVCHRAENEFVGVPCGIMDQFVSCLGKRGSALFLDCRTLDYEYVPLPNGMRLLICDTGVKRQLRSSEYALRRQECQKAVENLKKGMPHIKSLRDLEAEELTAHAGRLDPVLLRRSRHVVTEIARVNKARTCLQRNDTAELGQLLYESHTSLRDDFEVSCPELDTIVELCKACEGVYGARLTGAGFGGSVLCLVREGAVKMIRDYLGKEYAELTGRETTLYACASENGIRVRSVFMRLERKPLKAG